MSENKNPTELFNFMVVRNQPKRKENQNIILLGNLGNELSPLCKQLEEMNGVNEKQIKLATEFLNANTELYNPVKRNFQNIFESLWRLKKVDAEKVRNAIVQIVEKSDLSETGICHLLEDMLLAWSFHPPKSPDELNLAVHFLKFFYLGVNKTGQKLLPATLEDALYRIVVVLPKSLKNKSMRKEPLQIDRSYMVDGIKKNIDVKNELSRLKEETKILNEAIISLEDEIQSGRAIRIREESKEYAPQKNKKKLSFIDRIKKKQNSVNDNPVVKYTFNKEFDCSLITASIKDTLAKFSISIDGVSEMELFNRIGTQLQVREKRICQLNKEANTWIIVGNMLVKAPQKQIDGTENSSSTSNDLEEEKNDKKNDPSKEINYRMSYYAGLADLKIVKEKLVGYELGDIAHIENILAGEEKERRHRRMESTETEEVIVTEEEKESERDNQSTTKNELATESSTVAKSTVKVEGSLTVSGSYGPTVDFSASASAGYTNETTNSDKRAASFAQEVVQKTVEKVRSRVMEQRRVRTLSEIEETNIHALRNAYSGAKHVRGVYRWLNKICQAQVYNYGLRHMFSFVVPEPAAFYLWSLNKNELSSITEPKKPDFDASYITRDNYQYLAAEFGAVGVLPPLDKFVVVSESKASTSAEDANKNLAGEIPVPPGYLATGAHIFSCSTRVFQSDEGVPIVYWHLGPFNNWGPHFQSIGNVSGEISYGVQLQDLYDYVFSIDVKCDLNKESKEHKGWQTNTFEKILEGYKNQLSKYEENLANVALQQGIAIPGRNPLENEQTIKNELKRTCLSMFFRANINANPFLSEDQASADYWHIDYNIIGGYGKIVTILERAFEWENMTYVFSPYFYGRYSEWNRRVIELGATDPNMAAFLKAGAARVLVPASPEFAEMILFFAQKGYFPNETDSLITADDAIESMIEEVRSQGTDSIPNAFPEGDPWEIKLPTSLVLLQDPQDIIFRDALSGDQNSESKVTFDNQVIPAKTDTTSDVDS